MPGEDEKTLTDIAGEAINLSKRRDEAMRRMDLYEQALAAAREKGDRRAEGKALGELGEAFVYLGQRERDIEYCEQALAIAREIGAASTPGSSEWTDARCEEAKVLNHLGIAYKLRDEPTPAFQRHMQALKIYREIGDRSHAADQHLTLGTLLYFYGIHKHKRRAVKQLQQALEIYREIGATSAPGSPEWIDAGVQQVRVLSNLGIIHLVLKQTD